MDIDDLEDYGYYDNNRNEKQEKIESYLNKVCDFNLSQEEWISNLIELYNYDRETADEVINDICANYAESGVTSLRNACEWICVNNEFGFLTRFRCIETLYNPCATLHVLKQYKESPTDDMNFTMYCDHIIKLIPCIDERYITNKDIENLIQFVFKLKMVSWVGKYSLWKNLCKAKDMNPNIQLSMINNVGKILLSNNVLTSYTVLSMQLHQFDSVTLLALLNRVKTVKDEKIKGDLLDHLLSYPATVKQANAMLKELGGGMRSLDSAQNAHMVSADIDSWLIKLSSVNIQNVKYDDVLSELREIYARDENYDQIEHSLRRIEMDNSVYGKLSFRLMGILMRVWTKIKNYGIIDIEITYNDSISISEDNKQNNHNNNQTENEIVVQLTKRLKEELIEMAETCSTGHIVRLMNVFSGYEQSYLTVDPSVELKSVLNKRIEKYLDRLKTMYKDNELFPKKEIEEYEYKTIHNDNPGNLDDDEKYRLEKISNLRGGMKAASGKVSSSNLLVIKEDDENKEPEDSTLSLYDRVLEAWMDNNEPVLQKYLYSQLPPIHDELYNDYVNQGLMSSQEFDERYRDCINQIFVST